MGAPCSSRNTISRPPPGPGAGKTAMGMVQPAPTNVGNTAVARNRRAEHLHLVNKLRVIDAPATECIGVGIIQSVRGVPKGQDSTAGRPLSLAVLPSRPDDLRPRRLWIGRRQASGAAPGTSSPVGVSSMGPPARPIMCIRQGTPAEGAAGRPAARWLVRVAICGRPCARTLRYADRTETWPDITRPPMGCLRGKDRLR